MTCADFGAFAAATGIDAPGARDQNLERSVLFPLTEASEEPGMDPNTVGALDTITFSILCLEGALDAPLARPSDEPQPADTETTTSDASEIGQK
jgi:hypothetical protein